MTWNGSAIWVACGSIVSNTARCGPYRSDVAQRICPTQSAGRSANQAHELAAGAGGRNDRRWPTRSCAGVTGTGAAPPGPNCRPLVEMDRCQLWLTGREGRPERNVRSLAPPAQRSESSRQGVGSDRAAGSGQPGRRQAGRSRRVRIENRPRARLAGLLPATRKRADRAAVRWRRVEPGRRHRTRATHRSRLEEPDTR